MMYDVMYDVMYYMMYDVIYDMMHDVMYDMIGTENVALAVGLGTASQLALQESYTLLLHMLTLKRRLIELLLQRINDVRRILTLIVDVSVNSVCICQHHYHYYYHHHHHPL